MKKIATILLLLLSLPIKAQERPIKVVTEDLPNRLAFFAINENDRDFDVRLTISGTNFRQSKAKPRLIRVPGASKVLLTTIFLLRGKKPAYTYDLFVSDSISNKAMVTDFTKIKISPKKQIIIYLPKKCIGCDSIIMPLESSKYVYQSYDLDANPQIKEQLQRAFGPGSPIDSMQTPIVNMGGVLHTDIRTFDQLMEVLIKD
ncbi:MAG: hypothetical protein MUO53_17755 [Maribacter sp.]|nr:hypothetical protein [Maribacter sp.]